MHKFLPICFLFFVQQALAISNIENERPNLPNQGFSGNLKLTLNGKTGNQQEQTDGGATKLIFRSNDEILMLLLAKEYETKHETKTTDNSFLHTRWTHLLNETWAVESFTQWERDEFANLTERALIGGGGRYIVAQQKDEFSFTVGMGAFREYEKLNLVTYEEKSHIWRINSYCTYKYQINDQLLLATTLYYQPRTDKLANYRVLFDSGLSIKMTNSLQLKLNLKVNYDSHPAVNVALDPPLKNYKTNSEYSTSLVYNF